MSTLTRFDALMHEMCVEKGWCGSVVNGQPRHVTDFFPDSGEVTADQFVAWLLEAEGSDQRHHDFLELRKTFVQHMGGETVGVERLKWSVR